MNSIRAANPPGRVREEWPGVCPTYVTDYEAGDMERTKHLEKTAGIPSEASDGGSWEEVTESQPVDLDRLVESCDDDPELARELAGMWLKQSLEQMERMEEALKNGDCEQVRFVGHSCAGASATCGMVAASVPLRAMETAASEERLEDARQYFEEFKMGIRKISEFLNLYASDLSGTRDEW